MQNIEEIYKEYSTSVYKYLFCLTQNKEIQEEISIQEPVTAVNNYAVGILSFSAIFLILTIIFSIIFTKHQLKAKKKTSK